MYFTRPIFRSTRFLQYIYWLMPCIAVFLLLYDYMQLNRSLSDSPFVWQSWAIGIVEQTRDVQTIATLFNYGKQLVMLWLVCCVLMMIVVAALVRGVTQRWRFGMVLGLGLLPAQLFVTPVIDQYQIVAPAILISVIAGVIFWLQQPFATSHSKSPMRYGMRPLFFLCYLLLPAMLRHSVIIALLCIFFAPYYWQIENIVLLVMAVIAAMFIAARVQKLQPLYCPTTRYTLRDWSYESLGILSALLWVALIVALVFFSDKIWVLDFSPKDFQSVTELRLDYLPLLLITVPVGIMLGIFASPSGILLWVAMVVWFVISSDFLMHDTPLSIFADWLLATFVQVIAVAFVVWWNLQHYVRSQYRPLALVRDRHLALWWGLVYNQLPFACFTAIAVAGYLATTSQHTIIAFICALAIGVGMSLLCIRYHQFLEDHE